MSTIGLDCLHCFVQFGCLCDYVALLYPCKVPCIVTQNQITLCVFIHIATREKIILYFVIVVINTQNSVKCQ